MMKQMRDNTKWIMLLATAAFVALMVFEWGMDITGRSSMGIGQVGSVDGDPVMYDEYMANYQMVYDQVQLQQEEPISSQQDREIEDQAWQETVNQILIERELSERDITVTDNEVQQAARFSPPPQLRQNPAFLDTLGQFDVQRYQDFLQSSADNQTLFQLEQYYRSAIPRNKLMRQITSGIFPSDQELWQQYRDQNERVTARLASLDPDERVPDSQVSVSPEEIEAFYAENREDFRVPAQATMRIAVLSKAPTAADTAATLERAQEIRREIVEEGADFADVARRESADEGTAQTGGDLGVFPRGMMVPPFEEAAFAAEAGEVTEPVLSPSGYHIVQVHENYSDSIHASHILLPIERTGSSELEVLIHADSLEDMSESIPLEDAAANLGLTTNTVNVTEDFPFTAGAGQVSEAFDWARDEASPGDVSPVFENEQSFYAVELVEFEPEGYRTQAEAEDDIRQRLTLQKKEEILLDEAREMVERARAEGSLAAVAEEGDLEVQEPQTFTRRSAVQGAGPVPEVVGTAFGLDSGEIGNPVSANDLIHLVEVVERVPADSTAWLAQKEAQRQMAVSRIQQQRLDEWITALRENATIRDRREEVLRAAEEQQEQAPGIPAPF